VVCPALANFAQRELAQRQMTERSVDYIAEKSYTVTLAVGRQDADRKPVFHDPRFGSRGGKIRSGLQPGAIRLSLGLQDWHDTIAGFDAPAVV
jgi:hypothetical protein